LLHSIFSGLISLWAIPIPCSTSRHSFTSSLNCMYRCSNFFVAISQCSRWNWTAFSYTMISKGMLVSNAGPMSRAEQSLLILTYLIAALIRSLIVYLCIAPLYWSLATNSLFAQFLGIIIPYFPSPIILLSLFLLNVIFRLRILMYKLNLPRWTLYYATNPLWLMLRRYILYIPFFRSGSLTIRCFRRTYGVSFSRTFYTL
jgi:hypothetical protein